MKAHYKEHMLSKQLEVTIIREYLDKICDPYPPMMLDHLTHIFSGKLDISRAPHNVRYRFMVYLWSYTKGGTTLPPYIKDRIKREV